ncbi:MAG: GAF domain-containing protein [Candidatus Methylomirabilales bacterium]
MLKRHTWIGMPARVPKHPSVLVVDDETVTRKVYADLLAGAGFQTKTASSAEEAIGIAKTADLDVIVLDVMMPGMGGLAGLEALSRIRPEVPVIIVTSYSTTDNAISALKQGAYDFIPKGSQQLELIQVVSRAAQHRALILENQRLLSDLQDRVAQLTIINELSGIFRSTLDLQEILDLVLKKTQDLFDCEASSLLSKDQKTEELYFLVARGKQAAHTQSIRLRKGEGIAGWVFEHGETLLVPDVQADPRFSPRVDEITKFVTRSILAAPVKVKEQTIAVIELVNPRSGAFQQRDLDLFMMIAPQAGIAIENAKLYDDLRRQNQELSCLVRASQDLSASLEVEQIVQRIVHHVMDLTPAARSGIIFLDAGGRCASLMAGAADGRTGHEVKVGAQLDLSLYPEITHVMRTRRPLHMRNVFSDSLMKPARELIRPLGLSSLLVIPIQDQERVFGVISLAHFDPSHHFTDNDIAICQALANQASIALQNARLYGELVRKTVQLTEASRHKSEFLANMSHELRTPLNATIGFAELLRDIQGDNLTAKQRRYVENIHSSGKHLLELINNILDLSKVEAGKLQLHPETFPLVPAIEEVLSIMRPLSERKGLSLDVQLSETPTELFADLGRFKQILYNLLSNAIKFTPAQGKVNVSAKLTAPDGITPGVSAEGRAVLEVAVRDTGIGIPLEYQERIFETFEQVDSSLSREYEGTGLGLPLTKRLVELHGGRIWVESTPGCGSVFRFILPVDRCPPQPD